MTTATALKLPTGTWTIDTSHTEVGFQVKHMMITKVRGTFSGVTGTVEVADDVLQSKVDVAVDLKTVNTKDEKRDAHLRSADFFNTDTNDTMTFRSTEIREKGDDYLIVGDLTLNGITKPIELVTEIHGVGSSPFGDVRAGFSAEGSISRKDWGIEWNAPLETGGVLVSDEVKLQLEVELIHPGS